MRFTRAFSIFGLIALGTGCNAAGNTNPVRYDMGVTRDMSTTPPRDQGTPFDAPPAVPDLGRDATADMDRVDLGPDLGVDAGSFEPGANCNAPLPRDSGSYTAQTTQWMYNDFDFGTGTNCSFGEGADVVYSISVDAGQRIAVRVTPTGVSASMFDPTISLVLGPIGNCHANPTCVESADFGIAGEDDLVEWTNDTGAAVTIYAIVDTYDAGTEAPFTLRIYKTHEGSSGGNTCSAAPSIFEGIITSTTASRADNYSTLSPTCGLTSAPGHDAVYRISVPPDKLLYARVSSTDEDYDPALYLVSTPAGTCDANPLVCLAGADDESGGGEEEVFWLNDSSDTQGVYVIVDSFEAGTGNFTLSTFLL